MGHVSEYSFLSMCEYVGKGIGKDFCTWTPQGEETMYRQGCGLGVSRGDDSYWRKLLIAHEGKGIVYIQDVLQRKFQTR
jgi:hypothetical protein